MEHNGQADADGQEDAPSPGDEEEVQGAQDAETAAEEPTEDHKMTEGQQCVKNEPVRNRVRLKTAREMLTYMREKCEAQAIQRRAEL